MDIQEARRLYHDFIVANGNSENVRKMYCRRVEVFLQEHPEALDANEQGLRTICDDYVAGLPITSATEVAATAVRYFWTMRFGKPYFRRIRLSDFPRDEAIEREADGFAGFLRKSGIEEVTIANRVRSVKQFLYTTFPDGSFSRGLVCADAVRKFISTQLADASRSFRSRFTTEIRSYARFLMSEGCAEASDIALLPLKAPARAGDIGAVLPDEDYAAILSVPDAGTPRGKRDRAIVMLMGNLGLRASDVARLSLDDVDWDRGLLHVRNSKSKSDRTVPLDADTGRAVERYVVDGRGDRGDTRSLFLPTGRAADAPSMTSRQVADAVKLLAERAGVHGYRGSHSLRRAVATSMVRDGVSVKVVADVLGHENVSTTMRYLRVDVESLRKACSPWPGGGAA